MIAIVAISLAALGARRDGWRARERTVWPVAHGVAWRTLKNVVTNPSLLLPSLLFPLFFFTAFAGGLSQVRTARVRLPGRLHGVPVRLRPAPVGGVRRRLHRLRHRPRLRGRLRPPAAARVAEPERASCSATRSPRSLRWMIVATARHRGRARGRHGGRRATPSTSSACTRSPARQRLRLLWSAGIAMRFRTIQAGPLMQMPVFLAALLRAGLRAARRSSPAGCTPCAVAQPDHVRARGGAQPHRRASRAQVALGVRARRSRSPACSRSGPSAGCGEPKPRADRPRRGAVWARRYGAPVSRTTWPGAPFPLGPSWDGNGTNFSLFSENARRVELCLFDESDHEERVERAPADGPQLARLSPGGRPGTALRLPRRRPVGTRQAGHRFNPAKLLIDPYAKAIEGPIGFGRGPDPRVRARPGGRARRRRTPRRRSRGAS